VGRRPLFQLKACATPRTTSISPVAINARARLKAFLGSAVAKVLRATGTSSRRSESGFLTVRAQGAHAVNNVQGPAADTGIACQRVDADDRLAHIARVSCDGGADVTRSGELLLFLVSRRMALSGSASGSSRTAITRNVMLTTSKRTSSIGTRSGA